MTVSRPYRTVVIGSGIAGLSAALHLGDCTLITKTELGDGSTRWSQGGLAAAVGPNDSPDQHVDDTLRVSGGLGDRATARLVASAAPQEISWLANLGTNFDVSDGVLSLGREAGHSVDRIVHADGDATGKEVVRALTEAVRLRPDIEVREHTFVVDVTVMKGRVVGLVALDSNGVPITIATPSVVLATGGIGQVYSATTNPVECTGDGLAMAWRAGAAIRDCEFVQFHPTALATSGDPLPLLTEALRGAGGLLRNDSGERFMTAVHEDAELAPRAVVAQAMWQQLLDGPVFLDVRAIPDIAERFPTAARNAADAGFDLAVDLLPVTPAAHYHMGGIVVDSVGRSSIEGLYAAGEVSSTGLHGANRLASNSLVEGLVFGRLVADSIASRETFEISGPVQDGRSSGLSSILEPLSPAVDHLRAMMWRHGGIFRSAAGLTEAALFVESLRPDLGSHPVGRNLIDVSLLVLGAATARAESRGAHQRVDFPFIDPALDHEPLRHPPTVGAPAGT